VLSGWGDKAEIINKFGGFPKAVVSKPFKMPDLISLVQAVLEKAESEHKEGLEKEYHRIIPQEADFIEQEQITKRRDILSREGFRDLPDDFIAGLELESVKTFASIIKFYPELRDFIQREIIDLGHRKAFRAYVYLGHKELSAVAEFISANPQIKDKINEFVSATQKEQDEPEDTKNRKIRLSILAQALPDIVEGKDSYFSGLSELIKFIASSSLVDKNPQNRIFTEFIASSGLERAGPIALLGLIFTSIALFFINPTYIPFVFLGATVLAESIPFDFSHAIHYAKTNVKENIKKTVTYIPYILISLALLGLALYGLPYVSGHIDGEVITFIFSFIVTPYFVFVGLSYERIKTICLGNFGNRAFKRHRTITCLRQTSYRSSSSCSI
jgi:hypothetical protein